MIFVIKLILFIISLPIQLIGFLAHFFWSYLYTGWIRSQQFQDWICMRDYD